MLAILRQSGRPMALAEVAATTPLTTSQVSWAAQVLAKRGEVERVRRGVYRAVQ